MVQEGGERLKGPRLILSKDEGSNDSGTVAQSNEDEKTIDFPKTDGGIIFSSLLCFCFQFFYFIFYIKSLVLSYQ